MSRIQQDQFVDDDEEECCPLCVEEFDLSDKNFRPCPCGYQICQFCYNNIRNQLNGLCPACRRKYDDASIEFRNITPEELAKYKQQVAQKAKKNAQLRQKEAQKAEADSLSRKHLAGLRVVQKNLVYVTGLTPTIREDRLLETLRGPDYFGQYGKIIKIVVSKAKENAAHQQSVGVYVTFARKEDAAVCIAAVDGSQNGDRILRAQYGTTKYCSAYLRGEHCNNRNCMFLHEPGEENDSFTRQDLSMMNTLSTQQPAQAQASDATGRPPQPQPPPQRGPAIAAAAPMHRQDSTDAHSPTNDAPALPPTANWGNKATQGRRASRSTNASTSSPMTTNAVPAPQPAEPPKVEPEPAKKKGKEREKDKTKEKPTQPSKSTIPKPAAEARPQKPRVSSFDGLSKFLSNPDFKFVFNSSMLSSEELEEIGIFPLLIDPNGGAKRRAVKEKEKELENQREAEAAQAAQAAQAAAQPAAPTEREDNTEATAGGSLQLGGEPEERHESNPGTQHAIAPPGQHSLFGQSTTLGEDFGGINSRGLSAQQQQQLLLFKSSAPQSAGLLSNFQTTQGQQGHNQAGNAPGHARNVSRFSFANDSASASASVQPVGNSSLMKQQAAMMPKNTGFFNQISQHQPLASQYYTSGVQGPPPGLKATATPPVSGGGMFGQGHGFATGGLGGYGAGRNADAMYQENLRNRGMDGGARVADAAKRTDDQFFNPMEASLNVDALVNEFEMDTETAAQRMAMASHVLDYPRRSTPTIPPGFSAPATPKVISEQPIRPLSRNASGITPAIPIIPRAVPNRSETPTRPKEAKVVLESAPIEDVPAVEQADVAKEQVDTPQEAVADKTSPTKAAPTAPGTPKQKIETPPALVQKENTFATSKTKSATKAPGHTTASNKKGSSAPSIESIIEKDLATMAAATAAASKRKPPGKLDISAATKSAQIEVPTPTRPLTTEPQSKNPRTVSITSATSVPASPALPSTGSPVKRAAPRTIRVVPTPKTEVPPPLSAVSAASLPQLPSVDKLRSRQASIASIQSGALVSDFISETASVTSASISRASSPPPIGGKVGTAPVRKKTKAQAKKERQDRARQLAEEESMALEELKSSDQETVQAPIIGRKKKAKKPVANNPKVLVAAQKIQAEQSPVKAAPEEKEKVVEPEIHAPSSSKVPEEIKTPTAPAAKAQPSPGPSAPESPKEKSLPTAQSIIADLQKTGELLASTLEFFKPLSSTLAQAHAPRVTAPSHAGSRDVKGDARTLITPQGRFLWGLTKELEERALQLEKSIEECKGAARFRPRKNQIPQSSTTNSPTKSKPKQKPSSSAMSDAFSQSSSSPAPTPRLDPTATLLSSTSIPLPPVTNLPAPEVPKPVDVAPKLPPAPATQPIIEPTSYLNHYVLPRTDNPSPNTPRGETAAVGGMPPTPPSLAASQITKAAKTIAEGGMSSQEFESLGVMAADVLGGVVASSLEALVNAGLDFQNAISQNRGSIASGGALGGAGGLQNFDFAAIINQIQAAATGSATAAGAKRNVLSVEEAEQALHATRKETDVLEKKLSALMKKNRKLVGLGNVGGKA